jgi:hypothetical protein
MGSGRVTMLISLKESHLLSYRYRERLITNVFRNAVKSSAKIVHISDLRIALLTTV